MNEKIRVAILEDHQSIIDGYVYRLSFFPEIKVVGGITFGDQLFPFLKTNDVDVLILDISVQTSFDNPNPFPILFTIPRVLKQFPGLSILVISMHNQPGIIQALLNIGVRGYIVKDDRKSIASLADIIQTIHQGQIYLSPELHQILPYKFSPGIELNDRQLEVLSLCASHPGDSLNTLAEELEIASSTMRNLLSNIYQILDVSNRAAAILKARQMGIITPDEPGSY